MKEPLSSNEMLAKAPLSAWFLALVVLGFLAVASIVTGKTVGTAGLCDLDTCWLLASGKKMMEVHLLPQTDPFSYTFISTNRPFVMHQWLAELVFYALYRISGLTGIVYSCTFIVTGAFVCLPLWFASRQKRALAPALIVAALAPLSSLVRLLARPEIFSYLCLSTWFILLSRLRDTNNDAKPDWGLITKIGLVMILWTNFHSGFVLGILLLAYYVAEYSIFYFLIGKREKQRFNPTAVIAFVVAVFSTLCNPYGFGLLTYLQGLFSSPLKTVVTEMFPISIENLSSPLLWPFLVLVLVCSAIVTVSLSKGLGSSNRTVRFYKYSAAILMVLALSLLCVSARRFISFCVLTLVFQVTTFFASRAHSQDVSASSSGLNASGSGNRERDLFNSKIESCLARMGVPKLSRTMAIVCGLAFFGTALAISQCPLSLPQAVPGFSPPMAALSYIAEHQPTGNLYNDPHFGSMLIWYQPNRPKVFIDTRYDMYEFDFLRDYGEALLGRGYQSLFSKYKISWVFLKPHAPLVEILRRDPQWYECYRDQASVILQRR